MTEKQDSLIPEENIPAPQQAKKDKPTQYVLSDIKIVEWTNKNRDGIEFPSFRVQTFYKDKENNWQTSDNLNIYQLIKLKTLVQKVIDEKFPVVIK